MIEIIRTNDAVVLSFAQSLLRDAGIECLVADQNMSVLDGSIGILPRRILVSEDDAEQARRIFADAGIGNELRER
ncbi:putative signal transducing protein [Mesorhizobium sp. ASY16-5R]|uniref:putative signal transducing protein n=1 Tax=Mesorhizobium sp. ASY16-5R TaxID=3445772 RepID=UPI003F9F5A1E